MRALALAALLLCCAPAGAAEPEPVDRADPAALIRRVEAIVRGDTTAYKMSMTTATPRWTRTLRFRSWDDRAQDRSFTRILEPKKDRGTGFLKVGNTLWTYLPSVERVTRMPPSLLLQSWMGSDFTNDDIVRESSLIEDYTPSLLGEQQVEGVACVGLTLIPHDDAPVVWSRVEVWAEKERLSPVLFVYYDEPQPEVFEPIRRLHFSDVRDVQGRPFPHRWEMEPLEKPGHRTTIEIEEVRFDVPLDEGLFTRANLKRAEAVR